jgi:hypothetical protein
MGNAPEAVRRLVDHFDQDRKVFLSGDYKEEQLPGPRRRMRGPTEHGRGIAEGGVV